MSTLNLDIIDDNCKEALEIVKRVYHTLRMAVDRLESITIKLEISTGKVDASSVLPKDDSHVPPSSIAGLTDKISSLNERLEQCTIRPQV